MFCCSVGLSGAAKGDLIGRGASIEFARGKLMLLIDGRSYSIQIVVNGRCVVYGRTMGAVGERDRVAGATPLTVLVTIVAAACPAARLVRPEEEITLVEVTEC